MAKREVRMAKSTTLMDSFALAQEFVARHHKIQAELQTEWSPMSTHCWQTKTINPTTEHARHWKVFPQTIPHLKILLQLQHLTPLSNKNQEHQPSRSRN